jgi:hypothetical protein
MLFHHHESCGALMTVRAKFQIVVKEYSDGTQWTAPLIDSFEMKAYQAEYMASISQLELKTQSPQKQLITWAITWILFHSLKYYWPNTTTRSIKRCPCCACQCITAPVGLFRLCRSGHSRQVPLSS